MHNHFKTKKIQLIMYIQIYQTRITQGLKNIEHMNYQTFVFVFFYKKTSCF